MNKNQIINKLSKKDIQKRRTVRDKDLTKRLLMNAAATIIKNHGIKALGVSNVAKLAGRSKRMIYEYFGNLEGLLKALLNKTDFAINYDEGLDHLLEINKTDRGKELAIYSIQHYLEQFKNDVILQEISLRELNGSDEFIKEITKDREKYGEKLFSLLMEYFQNTNVHAKSLMAILYGSVNFLVLHRKSTGTTFAGLDIQNPEHQKQLGKTMELIIELLYKSVE